MKLSIKCLLTLSFAALFLNNCSTAPMNNAVQLADSQSYRSRGVIRSIDLASGKVVVDHEDIPGYMSPMEMNEPVADLKLLDGLKVGDKVEFSLLREGSKVTYTGFTKTGVDGTEIYRSNCAECHGGSGEGAKKGIPLKSGHALDHSEAEAIKKVTNGDGNKMPAFREKLTTEQIAAVVSFVRTTIQKDAPASKTKGHHDH